MSVACVTSGHRTLRARSGAGLLATAALLAGCGGSPTPSAQAQACSPNNPYRADATASTTLGSLATEKAWMRDHFVRSYLWFSEVPSVNASNSAYSNEADVVTSLDNYFHALLTPALTLSGARKDQFSFTYPTREWDVLINGGTNRSSGHSCSTPTRSEKWP